MSTVVTAAVPAEKIPAAQAVLSGNVEQTQNGVIIRAAGKSGVGKAGAEPDLTFRIRVSSPGLYVLWSVTAVDEAGLEKMRRAKTKFDSMEAQFQIDDRIPTTRYVFVPWAPHPEYCDLALGKFYFTGKDQLLKIWLPEHCGLKEIQLVPFTPCPIPAAAQNYVPPCQVPATHPRLWLRRENLPAIRKNLTSPENLPYWQAVQQEALTPFRIRFDSSRETKYNTALENAVIRKAFYFLMTGDRKIGDEAVNLIRQYMELVEFGNCLDITREIGWAIHVSACVYDWCYSIMTPEDKASIRKNMLRLALDMECSWPPFGKCIVSGHGNEFQLTRDLLAMAIAVYDEDPIPFKYCSYQVLEELVPMRKFDYRSPRHSQGISYGAFRLSCDLRSALLFKRMLGQEVFDENIKKVPLYWFYMQLPGDTVLRDGDGVWVYNCLANLLLLSSAYTGNSLYKGEMLRLLSRFPLDGKYPVAFLLLNDPGVKPEYSRSSLPLAIDFGPVLSGMVIRTGWDIGAKSRDVVAEIKGGGFNIGGHQHPDAGSFQIWYKGFLAAKLGLYHFYGTPYDRNFHKRSVSQPMMLVRDPQECFKRCTANDGGSRIPESDPRTPEQEEKESRCGSKLYCSFGPSAMHPLYGSYAADLTGAYGPKLTSFVRTFHFFNLEDEKIPAVILMTDDINSRDPSFRKYWQINTLEPPELTPEGAVLKSPGGGTLHLAMPVPAKKTVQHLSGKEVYNIFGVQFEPPAIDLPEARGHRLLFSPEKSQTHDRFLVMMQVADAGVPPMKIRQTETARTYIVKFKDWSVVLNKDAALLNSAFELTAESSGRILAAGLAAGIWSISGPQGVFFAEVRAGKNTLYLTGPAGGYRFEPGRKANAVPLPVSGK